MSIDTDATAAHGRAGVITNRARLTLLLLAAATLVVMTTETLPVGLLPQMARSFGLGQGQLGLLVTVYGGVVVVGAIPLSILVSRAPTRLAMLVVLALFVVSLCATAASRDMTVALGARVVGGIAHAVFYSCSFTMATSVVAPSRRGRAVATVGIGNALALALGVPAATALGAWVGWRIPFWGSAALLVSILVALAVTYRPLSEDASETEPSTRALLGAIRSWPLARVALTIVLVMAGHFLTYTYISPILTVAGVPQDFVSLVLVGYGASGVLGLWIASHFSDSRPRRLLLIAVAVTLAALSILFVGRGLAPIAVAGVAVWGAAFGAAPVLWQLLAVRAAPAVSSIGPAVVNSAFNVGISLGALGGGQLLRIVHPGDLAVPSIVLIAIALILVTRGGWLPRD